MEPAERTRRCVVCQAVYRDAQSFCPIDGGAIVEPTDEDPYIGRTIDSRYIVDRRIGRGGMGVVYEAAHIGLDKRVALKFLLGSNDADALARFRREARIASKIDHENVVNILDIGRDDRGNDYLAMELVKGRDLQQLLMHDGKLEPARAVAVVKQILRGLAAIHAAGILHRDLKPSNVIVVGEVAKIMDFGISKSMASVTKDNVTDTGAVIGTPQYMSPEQLLGDAIDPRSDLFAVGLILFALLAGEPPFEDNTVSRLAAVYATQDIPSLATRRNGLPAALVDVVAKAVARQREDRYATADAFERALAAIDLAGPIDAGDRWMVRTANVSAPEPATKRERPATPTPSRVPWVVAGVLLAAAAMAVVLIATRTSSSVVVDPDAAVVVVQDAKVEKREPPRDADARAEQLALARRADADGKVELAIALYADIVMTSPSPDLLFRLGELHERAGNNLKAAESFTRYLQLAPAATERAVVEKRIARLRPPVVVAKRPPPVAPKPSGPKKKCYCFFGGGSDASHFRLCRGPAKPPILCSCRGPTNVTNQHTLCSQPGKDCSGTSVPNCFDGLLCDDPGWGSYTISAKKGEPCTGYRGSDTLLQGTYTCAVCDKDLGQIYEGREGDACIGYGFIKGEKLDGTLNNCW